MSSKLSDNIKKNSVFWIKWELEDLQGNKFNPPQYHYYKAKATGKKRNNMFQVRYDDGTEQYYSTRGVNTRTKNILTDGAYNNGNIITAEEKQPRVGPEFQAVVDASPGPKLPNSKFRQNALQLVPLTNKEIEEQDANTQLSAAVQADMDKSGMSKDGYEGGKHRKRKTRKRKAGMKKRLQKKLLEKQEKKLQEIGAANYQRDKELIRYMVSPQTKKRLRDMKNAGIDPQTAYDKIVEEYNTDGFPAINQFLNEVSISNADRIAKVKGLQFQIKEEKEKMKQEKKKARAKRKKANRKRKTEISNLLNQPPGSGKPIKWDEAIMHMDTGGEGSDRMYSREGGRRKKTRKMKGGHHLYKRLGVSKYASQKQIKKAYNKLKKKKKLTKKVKHAYKILSKKKTRKQYNNRYRKVMKHKKHTRKKRGGNDVWDLKKKYENIMNKYDHDIFWIDNAHKGQRVARKMKNVWRKFAGEKKATTEAQAKAQRNTKLEALKKEAWELCEPDKEKYDKIKESEEVAQSGQGKLSYYLKDGKLVELDKPTDIRSYAYDKKYKKEIPDWNLWTVALQDELTREKYRLEAEMNKSGLYGVCDIYNKINEILGEDKDKENNPHEENKQRELDNNFRTMGLQG